MNVPDGDATDPLVSHSVPAGDASPAALLAASDPPRVRWTTGDGLDVAAAGAVARLEPSGEDRFDHLRERAADVFEGMDHDGPSVARPRAFGGLSFLPDHEPGVPWTGFPPAWFAVPAIQVVRRDGETWLTATGTDAAAVEERLDAARASLDGAADPAPGPAPGVAGTDRVPSRGLWMDLVERAARSIRDGAFEKTVLAAALTVDLAGDPDVIALQERLGERYPECYRFLVEPTAGAAFLGAPPERLVRLSGRQVETEALAGTVERGETPEADAALAESLLDSEKLHEEHRMVADAIRDWLAPLGAVHVGERDVHRLSNVQHLRTPIAADLDDDAHVLDVVEALHPTPAVGGLPREPAVSFLRAAEPFRRGWYASPVGWFDADGDGEFAVAIRSGVVADRRATLFAGNGIVGDSDPEEEYPELQAKYRPLLDELEGEA